MFILALLDLMMLKRPFSGPRLSTLRFSAHAIIRLLVIENPAPKYEFALIYSDVKNIPTVKQGLHPANMLIE